MVVIGASAGGLNAFRVILAGLPKDFPVPIVLVQHLSPEFPSKLAQILSNITKLRVKEAEQGDLLRAGHVYIAPPGRHLLVNANLSLSLSLSSKVHHSRPSVDVLFRSAAASCATGTIGVVLTGGDGDGSGGIQTIKAAGGVTIVQDLPSSQQPSMPLHAVATGDVDFVLPLVDIANALIALVSPHSASTEMKMGGAVLNAVLADTALERVQAARQRARSFKRNGARPHEITRLVTSAMAELDDCLEALAVAEQALSDQNDALEDFQLALRKERRHYQALLAFVSDAIVGTDAQGIIRAVNPAAVKLMGLTARYLIGKPFISRARQENIVFEQVMRQMFATGIWEQEHGLGLKVRGGLAPVSATASRLEDEHGNPTDLQWSIRRDDAELREETIPEVVVP
ncbi:MAG: chemotaxis protein CheB [Janthinobacterium lividum]